MNIRPKLTIPVILVLIACLGTGVATAQLSLSTGVKLTQNSSVDIQPAWSPDGRKIVFVSSPSGAYVNHEIYVMDANGSNPIRLTNNSVYDGDPDWSPDGTKIVFTSNYEIYMMNADGSNPTRLTETVQSYAPAWSPDGTQIAFTSNTRSGGGGEIYVMNTDGSNLRNLTQNGDDYFDAYPTWSPDGAKIAFYSASDRLRDRSNGIYTMNADGSNPTRLAGTGQVYDLTYSSDGAKIAFVTGSNIYVMDADGSNRVQLTESNDIDLFGIDWSPDGRELVFVSARDGDKDIYVSSVNQTVNIPDPNLRAAIEEALGKASGATITTADMATLIELEAPNANISNLTGLEHAINLTDLNLGAEWVQTSWINSNSVSDLSVLAGLINLTRLNLGDNTISDISALSGLTNLIDMDLWGNTISDISALSGLTNLTELKIGFNTISDISALSGLTNLTELWLYFNRISDLSALAGLTNLTRLNLGDNTISDISALSGLTNLINLNLDHNKIVDISALSGLTNLAELWLDANNISDLSPLVSNTGLGTGNYVGVERNPLSDQSINTYIPVLQQKGVRVFFDDTPERPIVRLIYFLPNDRQPQPDINAKMDTLIKDVQAFFANEIERHGFGRKTFLFEDDNSGQAIVHHVQGRFNEAYYHENRLKVWDEISSKFDLSKDIYFTMLEIGSRVREDGATVCIPGTGLLNSSNPSAAGVVILPAFGDCFGDPGIYFAAHEIGHACGLPHDFRGPAYLMSYEAGKKKLSRCAAEWLTAHRAFNPARSTGDTYPTFEMLPPEFVSAPYTIRLRFEVTDPDGLHQAQLRADIGAGFSLIGCQGLNGKTHATVEIDTTHLTQTSTLVYLQTMDVHGNFGWEQRFPIDLTALRPPTVNIPDPNLRAAIEKALGKTSGAAITTADMATLTTLDARGSDISNLTGLEHATNLTELSLDDNNISDILPLVSNTGLGNGDKVNVRGNPLNAAAIDTHIPTLQGRGVEVQFDAPQMPQPFIYWTAYATGKIQRANLDGSNVQDLITPTQGLSNPSSITLDVVGEQMYWTDWGTGKIQRADLDGSNIQDLVTQGLEWLRDMDLDVVGGKMYWTDGRAHKIQRANLDGSNVQDLVTRTQGLSSPYGIALDASDGKMYWTNGGANKIQRANLDGSNVQDLVTLSGLGGPYDIVLDVVGGKMYWTHLDPHSDTGKIQRADLDGSNVQDLVTKRLSRPYGLALDVVGGKMYWTDELARKIQRADLDGSNVQDFVTGLQSPLGIAIGIRAIIVEPPQSVNILVVEGIVYEADGATPVGGVNVTVTVGSEMSQGTTASDGSFEAHFVEILGAVATTGDAVSIVVTDTEDRVRGKTEFILTNEDLGEGSAATITREVQFDPLTPTTLQKISGDNQKGVPGAVLAEPFVVEVSYDDGTPAVGMSITFTVIAGGGTLSATSVETDASGKAESTLTLGIDVDINTVSVSAAGTQQTVTFNAVGESPHFDLSVPAGTSLIHVPLKVTAVDGVPQTITSVADLYDALGGEETVNLLATYGHQTQQWRSYRGPSSRGTAADPVLTDDTGIMAGIKKTVTLRLSGDALGTDGTSSITLHPGTNVVGLPLKARNITRVSDLFTLDGIKDNVTSIIVSDKGKFKIVGRAGDDGDILITGGQAFSLPAQQAATVTISGEG